MRTLEALAHLARPALARLRRITRQRRKRLARMHDLLHIGVLYTQGLDLRPAFSRSRCSAPSTSRKRSCKSSARCK